MVDELQQLPPFDLQSNKLNEYPGTYHSDELGISYELRLENETLVMFRKKIRFESLLPAATDLFKGGTCTITFVRDSDGSKTGFMLSANRMKNIFFENQQ